MTAVLIAEDDAATADPIVAALRRAGYDVEVRADGPSALSCLLSGGVELAVLNATLPGLDGLELTRRLREQDRELPVLIVAQAAEPVDAVASLDAGADDYVARPYRVAEVVARVRALLRRSAATPSPSLVAVQDVRMDVAGHQAWLETPTGTTELTLTSKEFDLLRVLMREAGSVVTRAQLMNEVWGVTWWGSTKTLDMHVSWLRRKLGDRASAPRYITTVRGVGFRFER